jgi:hypothetical protein
MPIISPGFKFRPMSPFVAALAAAAERRVEKALPPAASATVGQDAAASSGTLPRRGADLPHSAATRLDKRV